MKRALAGGLWAVLFFVFFLGLGLFQVFGGAGAGEQFGDVLRGDLGDVRFNILVLEHTWRWFQGLHPSLFDLPMFAPATNVYSYSDLWFGLAPIYWTLRSGLFGPELDMYAAYQGLMIAGAVLNFSAFYALARALASGVVGGVPRVGLAAGAAEGAGAGAEAGAREFVADHSRRIYAHWVAAVSAYIFSFALVRQSNMYHPQLWCQFWIVISALGLCWWLTAPRRELKILGPWLFVGGAALQFVTAFYFVWFWVWSLAVMVVAWAILNGWIRDRRFLQWRARVRELMVPTLAWGGVVSPFLFRYVMAAKTEGRMSADPHSWVAIVATVPRPSTWWMLPDGHWQTDWLTKNFEWTRELREWVFSQPMWQEHLLGTGVVTSVLGIAMLVVAVQVLRRSDFKKVYDTAGDAGPDTPLEKKVLRTLAAPILAMLFFTLCLGRFSPWVLVTYLFPAGQVIRAVGRIQIFMLLFWALLAVWMLVRYQPRTRTAWSALGLALAAMVAEAHWSRPMSFTRAESEARIEARVNQSRVSIDQAISRGERCDYLYYSPAFLPGHETENLDAVFAAWRLGFTTANGYSGRVPRNYANTKADLPALMPGLRGCE